jgi:general secretion pathway protein A
MIHEAATGGMRDIDRLATAALREAARRKKKLVERDVLARVVDLDQIVGAA